MISGVYPGKRAQPEPTPPTAGGGPVSAAHDDALPHRTHLGRLALSHNPGVVPRHLVATCLRRYNEATGSSVSKRKLYYWLSTVEMLAENGREKHEPDTEIAAELAAIFTSPESTCTVDEVYNAVRRDLGKPDVEAPGVTPKEWQFLYRLRRISPRDMALLEGLLERMEMTQDEPPEVPAPGRREFPLARRNTEMTADVGSEEIPAT